MGFPIKMSVLSTKSSYLECSLLTQILKYKTTDSKHLNSVLQDYVIMFMHNMHKKIKTIHDQKFLAKIQLKYC